MPLFEFEGKGPTIHPTAFVAPTATIVGDVTIEEEASVWYGAVVRADYEPVVIRAGANIQDGSILHSPPGMAIEVGAGATVAHLCVVHGAVLGEECLVANGATILDGARIGARAMIAAGAVVKPNDQIPDGMLAAGVPATVKGPIAGTASEMWVTMNPPAYRALAQRHRAGVRALDAQPEE
ncbi:MAG TPA: gamma carbonic anhydrase family protein [Actinomycetota bacterium]|nr:gamma carbonic anhydrase family protein [Actinomycetota bacterium]